MVYSLYLVRDYLIVSLCFCFEWKGHCNQLFLLNMSLNTVYWEKNVVLEECVKCLNEIID